MDEERVVKAYEEIMQCTEQDARCVFMFISTGDDELETIGEFSQTSS